MTDIRGKMLGSLYLVSGDKCLVEVEKMVGCSIASDNKDISALAFFFKGLLSKGNEYLAPWIRRTRQTC